MALTLAQRVEAERLRAKLDERRYIRRLIESGRRGEDPTAGLCAMNPNPIERPARRREYVFITEQTLENGHGCDPANSSHRAVCVARDARRQ